MLSRWDAQIGGMDIGRGRWFLAETGETEVGRVELDRVRGVIESPKMEGGR